MHDGDVCAYIYIYIDIVYLDHSIILARFYYINVQVYVCMCIYIYCT